MKAYSISVKFNQPQAGVVAIAAENKEEAAQKMRSLLDKCVDVEIVEVVEVPSKVLIEAFKYDPTIDPRDFIEEAVVLDKNEVN